jgi:hypothetical protein
LQAIQYELRQQNWQPFRQALLRGLEDEGWMLSFSGLFPDKAMQISSSQ